jgi:glutamate--cysteine ligase
LAGGGTMHRDALAAASATLRDTATAPSARVLSTMAREFDHSYIGFVRAHSLRTREQLRALPFDAALKAHYVAQSQASIEEQARIEGNDSLPFEIYRQQYLLPERLNVPAHRKTVAH